MAESSEIVFAIGAQKAGTTWLYRQLDKLDSVRLPKPKELHYWNCVRSPFHEHFRLNARQRRLPASPGNVWQALRLNLDSGYRKARHEAELYQGIFDSGISDHDRYLDYLGVRAGGYRTFGDVTPAYALLGRETFAEMHACHDKVKFVFIMRDPVERLWSGVRQRNRANIRRGIITDEQLYQRFMEALTDELHPDLLRSNYKRTIEELEAGVPPESIHYAFFENIFHNETNEVEKLAEFLELDRSVFRTDDVVHKRSNNNSPDSEALNRAEDALGLVYSFVRERFSDRVPEQWRR